MSANAIWMQEFQYKSHFASAQISGIYLQYEYILCTVTVAVTVTDGASKVFSVCFRRGEVLVFVCRKKQQHFQISV